MIPATITKHRSGHRNGPLTAQIETIKPVTVRLKLDPASSQLQSQRRVGLHFLCCIASRSPTPERSVQMPNSEMRIDDVSQQLRHRNALTSRDGLQRFSLILAQHKLAQLQTLTAISSFIFNHCSAPHPWGMFLNF